MLTLAAIQIAVAVDRGPMKRVIHSRRVLTSIGWMTEQSTGLTSPDENRSSIGTRMIVSATDRCIVLRGGRGLDLKTTFNAASDEPLLDSVVLALRSREPDAALAQLVYETLVLDPLSAGTGKVSVALQLAGKVAETLTAPELRGVANFAITRARQPIDPYDPSPITGAASSALVDLLVARPELDEQIRHQLSPAAAERTHAPPEARWLGAAVRRRPPDGGRAVADALRSWKPSSDAALEFLDAAARSLPRPPLQPDPPSMLRSRLRAAWVVATRLAAVLVGPLMALTVGWWAHTNDWGSASAEIGMAEALAALAVLVTVNVLTVELSADRLRGPVAAVAGQPRSLWAAYSAVLSATAMALLTLEDAKLTAARTWAQVSMALLFTAALVIVVMKVARRTDPSQAAQAFRRAREATFRSTGRRLGRLQGRSAAIRAEVGKLHGVTVTVQPARVGRRLEVMAHRRGFLLPSRRHVDRLSRSATLQSNRARLRITGGLGTIVERGERIASIIPRSDAAIDPHFERVARRSLKLRRVRRLDDITSATVALFSLSFTLAENADFGNSRVVAQEACRLLTDHVQSARGERRRALDRHLRRTARREAAGEPLRRGVAAAGAATLRRDEELAPVIPAIRSAVQTTVRRSISRADDMGDLEEFILDALLAMSGKAEATVAMATTSIPNSWSKINAHPSAVGDLLAQLATRAMETQDIPTLAVIRDRISSLYSAGNNVQKSEMHFTSSVITAISCWVLPDQAPVFLESLRSVGGIHAGSLSALLGYCRAGAASLLVGLPTIALLTSREVLAIEADLDKLERRVLSEAVRLREETNSSIRGNYLGDSPSDALADFVQFARAMNEANLI